VQPQHVSLDLQHVLLNLQRVFPDLRRALRDLEPVSVELRRASLDLHRVARHADRGARYVARAGGGKRPVAVLTADSGFRLTCSACRSTCSACCSVLQLQRVHGCWYALDPAAAYSAVCACSASTACYRAPCALSVAVLVVLLFTILCCAGGWLARVSCVGLVFLSACCRQYAFVCLWQCRPPVSALCVL
jgi:hypothetical protein